MLDSHVAFLECTLCNGALVLTVCYCLTCRVIEDTSLLAECRTDASCELREVIGCLEYLVCCLPVATVECIVPFRVLVAEWACPVAERYATVHTTACLLLAVLGVKCLFDLSKVMDTVIYWSITSLLTRNG